MVYELPLTIVRLTLFFHASSETFLESTVSALIPFILVYDTTSGEATCILMTLSDASTKKSLKYDHH